MVAWCDVIKANVLIVMMSVLVDRGSFLEGMDDDGSDDDDTDVCDVASQTNLR